MSQKVLIDFASNLSFTNKDIRDFIQKNWLRETLLSDKNFYQWQFIDPVYNMYKDYVVLAIYNYKIVGFLGLNRREILLNEVLLNAAELTTWIIKTEYQKKGFAKPMLEFIKNNFDIAYGANITTEAIKVYLRLGFHYIKNVPRLLKIYDYNKVSKLGKINPLIKKVYKNNVSTILKYENIHFNDIKYHQNVNGFNRSLENLLWRYEKHPIYVYKCIGFQNFSKEWSYIIYRIEFVNEVKIMIITEILYVENIDLSIIDNYAFDNDIDMVEFYSTHNKLNAKLAYSGFIVTSEVREFLDIPYLYNPLEIKSSKSYSLIFYAKNEYLLECFDYGNLYITKSDCDLDRPNYEYLKKIGKN